MKVEKSEAYGWTVFVDDLKTEDPVTFVAGRGYDPDSEDIAIRHAEVICKIIVEASEQRHDAFVVFKKNRLFQPSIESGRGLLWLESADDLQEAEDICDRALAMIDSALLPLAKKQEAEEAKLAQQEELRKRKLAEKAYELKHPKPVKPETELLTWTSVDGKFTIDAHAIDGSSELGDEWVTLRKQDGVVKTVPLIRLAPKDRYIVYDYVEKTLATFEVELEQWEAAKQAALPPKASSPTKPTD
ncbi:hypothetical protein [Rosistilla oblonga]|uniref:hypothetical protein n=1 Tax=Rosistilla oblonga TaxID=2527990 RepID=UPI003A97E8FC